jgi:hydrogenase expression/formation protein HypE
MTILAPIGTTTEEINEVMVQANDEANKIGAEIIGGHTEVTSAVNKMVISVTAIGRSKKDKLVNTNGAKVGDALLMTKYAALEGTGIICSDKADELKDVLTEDEIMQGARMLDEISVLNEGRIGGEAGVSSMHDVTEGGVYGALWEICQASGVGCEIELNNITVKEVTKKICEKYNISPYKLISSGSMLMTISKEKLSVLEKMLEKESIMYSVLGHITSGDRICVIDEDNLKINIDPPETDELYKVI